MFISGYKPEKQKSANMYLPRNEWDFSYQHSIHWQPWTYTHQHIRGVQVVLAGHKRLQFLRNLFDVLDLIQQAQDMLVLDTLYPQLPQFISLTVEEHLTGQQVLLDLSREKPTHTMSGEQLEDPSHLMKQASSFQFPFHCSFFYA